MTCIQLCIPGAGQGVGGVHKQQEEGGPSLETKGGQIF